MTIGPISYPEGMAVDTWHNQADSRGNPNPAYSTGVDLAHSGYTPNIRNLNTYESGRPSTAHGNFLGWFSQTLLDDPQKAALIWAEALNNLSGKKSWNLVPGAEKLLDQLGSPGIIADLVRNHPEPARVAHALLSQRPALAGLTQENPFNNYVYMIPNPTGTQTLKEYLMSFAGNQGHN